MRKENYQTVFCNYFQAFLMTIMLIETSITIKCHFIFSSKFMLPPPEEKDSHVTMTLDSVNILQMLFDDFN